MFALLNVTTEEALPPQEVEAFCDLLRARWCGEVFAVGCSSWHCS